MLDKVIEFIRGTHLTLIDSVYSVWLELPMLFTLRHTTLETSSLKRKKECHRLRTRLTAHPVTPVAQRTGDRRMYQGTPTLMGPRGRRRLNITRLSSFKPNKFISRTTL